MNGTIIASVTALTEHIHAIKLVFSCGQKSSYTEDVDNDNGHMGENHWKDFCAPCGQGQ